MSGGRVAFELLPNVDLLRCLFREGAWWLAHTITGEKVEVVPPHGDAGWTVDCDALGFAYLEDDDRNIWCQTLLRGGIYKMEGDVEPRVAFFDGPQRTRTYILSDWLSQHQRVDITISKSNDGDDVSFEAALFTQKDGARLWWSMQSFYEVTKLSKPESAARWCEKFKDTWAKFIGSIGLSSLHFRRTKLQLRKEGVCADGDRCLPWNSVSTHALIALAVRMTSQVKSLGGLDVDIHARQRGLAPHHCCAII